MLIEIFAWILGSIGGLWIIGIISYYITSKLFPSYYDRFFNYYKSKRDELVKKGYIDELEERKDD